MSPITMPQLAHHLGINVEHIGFAARLGLLPQPVGRDADGFLLYDADVANPPSEKLAHRLGAPIARVPVSNRR